MVLFSCQEPVCYPEPKRGKKGGMLYLWAVHIRERSFFYFLCYNENMKKQTKKLLINFSALVLICALLVGGVEFFLWQERVKANSEIQIITKLVLDFGERFKNVPLLAERAIAAKAIQENYSEFVAPELLEIWRISPTSAPGRVVSSPWPDHIEISSIKKDPDEQYKVVGQVVELTSKPSDASSSLKRTIRLNIQKIDRKWMVSKVY